VDPFGYVDGIDKGAVSFIVTISKMLPAIDVQCIIYPLLKPFLKHDCSNISEEALIYSLKSPVIHI
jgi:phosphoinositide-3-kinase, regulatory subunit 4